MIIITRSAPRGVLMSHQVGQGKGIRNILLSSMVSFMCFLLERSSLTKLWLRREFLVRSPFSFQHSQFVLHFHSSLHQFVINFIKLLGKCLQGKIHLSIRLSNPCCIHFLLNFSSQSFGFIQGLRLLISKGICHVPNESSHILIKNSIIGWLIPIKEFLE